MKKSKKLGSGFLVALVLICCFSTASAAEETFLKADVDSNSFSYITAAKKDTVTSYATVMISNIYDAEGEPSNYKKVYVRAMYNGEEISVTKGTSKDIPIASSFQSVGNYINMYAKGNDPRLDCQITGTWNAH